MRVKQIALLLLASLAVSFAASATENKKMTREEYIQTYAPLAVEQMACYGIPASITLAQGLLESANGNSELATKANNHFGIKCSNSWNGPFYRHDDDAPQECFRVYNSVRESYIDHSLILLERKWYQPLFELDMKDYKAWAHGLKKAGYATNPKYADSLIEIIEKYELYKYDNALLAGYTPAPEVEKAEAKEATAESAEVTPAQESTATESEVQPEGEATTTPDDKVVSEAKTEEAAAVTPESEVVDSSAEVTESNESAEQAEATPTVPQKVDVDSYDIAIQYIDGHGIYNRDGRKFVIAAEGDSLASLAKMLGLSERTLRRINTLDKNYTVSVGDKIFIER